MMQTKLHKETVSDALWWTLKQLMEIKVLLPFRLVGGTSLSLQLGHRISVDIDLKNKLIDFQYADADFDPICLKGKYWELIKQDIEEEVSLL